MEKPSGQVPSHLRAPHGAASVHLDALRGIAAVGVCLSHLRDFFFVDYQQVPHHNPLIAAVYMASGLGHECVIVFFVLSGYLVGGSVLRSMALDRWSWREYLLNRMTRLYTVLVPALALGTLLDQSGIHLFGANGIYGGNAGTHGLNFAVGSRLSSAILLGNYAFLQGIYVPTFGSNAPLWSLANEFWYYIAFPFLACALWPRLSASRRLLNLLLLVALVVFMRPEIALSGLTWLMGVAIHFIPRMPAENMLMRRSTIVAAIAACGVTLIWCKLSNSPGTDYLIGLAFSGLIYVILACSRTAMPRAYNWLAHVLSRSSYTLYLVHVPFLVFLAAFLIKQRWMPTAQHFLAGIAIFFLVLMYAQGVWFLFENRTDAIRARIKPIVLRRKSEGARTPTHV
jgi:peptidoglycan/LPS O-acetylase OafA/YrhL